MLGRCRPVFSLSFIAALAALGCASQSGTSYRGEPLAELRGSVKPSSTGAAPAAPLSAALLWIGVPPGADAKASVWRQQVGTTVPVSGAFPAQFALQIYTPPPDDALFTCFTAQPERPGKIASASVAAILQGARTDTMKQTDLYGQVRDFLVVYVDADLPATSDCPVGALAKGYHLFHSAPKPAKPGCVPQAADDPSCDGGWPYAEVPMSTELTLLLSHDSGNAQPPRPTPEPPKDAGP
jgi:hypothetical protein